MSSLPLLGGSHGAIQFVIRYIQMNQPEAIILFGDVPAQRPLKVELASILKLTEVWRISGNHDTDSDGHHNLLGSELVHHNLYSRVVEIAGARVAGLGGISRESIWSPPLQPVCRSDTNDVKMVRPVERWRIGPPLGYRYSIGPDVYERLACQRLDIGVTDQELAGHPHGCNALDDLATTTDVQLVVHGHLHQTIDYVAEGRLDADASYEAFCVTSEHFLSLPLDPAHPALGLP